MYGPICACPIKAFNLRVDCFFIGDVYSTHIQIGYINTETYCVRRPVRRATISPRHSVWILNWNESIKHPTLNKYTIKENKNPLEVFKLNVLLGILSFALDSLSTYRLETVWQANRSGHQGGRLTIISSLGGALISKLNWFRRLHASWQHRYKIYGYQ